MTFGPSNSLAFQIPENIVFTKDNPNFLVQLTDIYTKLSKASNSKDYGGYEQTEIINGQKFFGDTPQQKKQIYRKVIECGALPNAGLKQVAHGISGIDNNWFFTRIYGTAFQAAGAAPRPFFIPLPNSGNYQVEILIDVTNVNITTVADLSDFTYSTIVLEYYKN